MSDEGWWGTYSVIVYLGGFVAIIWALMKLKGFSSLRQVEKRDAASWNYMKLGTNELIDIHKKYMDLITSPKTKPEYYREIDAIKAVLELKERQSVSANRIAKSGFSFYELDGIPIWQKPNGITEAFDTMPPRPLPDGTSFSNSARISYDEFTRLIGAHNFGRDPSVPVGAGQQFADSSNINVVFERAGLIPPPN